MSHIIQRKRSFSRTRMASSVSLGTALFAGLISSGATAAEAPNANNITLPEVSVNASKEAVVSDYQKERMSSPKFTAPVSKTPQTIQIIDKALIEDQHATTLTEALKNSPGVGTFYVGENGNTSTGDSVYMRGFDSSSSIFVDGVRDTGSISRDTFNTEQVEVIKGPNGADYGRTAPGGSINMVTKQAHLKHSHSVNISGGTDDQKRITADINHMVGEHTAVRLNLVGEDSGVPGRDMVENKRWGIAPAVSFGLGTDTRLRLNYLHITQNNIPDGGVPTLGLPGYNPPASQGQPGLDPGNAPKVDSNNFYGTRSDHDDVTVDMFTALFEQDFGDSKTFHNTTRFGRTQQDYQLSAFMFSVDSSSPYNNDSIHSNGQPNNPAAWTMRRLPNYLDQTNTIITNQSGIVQFLKTGQVEHSLSYGLEFAREKVENVGMAAPIDPGTGKPTSYEVNIYNPSHVDASYYGVKTGADSEGRVDTAAIYLFDSIKFNDHWKLVTGLRLDHYNIEFDDISTTCGGRGGQPTCGSAGYTVGANTTTSDSDNLFTWQLGAVYQINDAGNVYVDYAVAAQPPGGDSLEFSSRANSQDQTGLAPQKAKTAEIGTKWKLADNRLLLTAAVYQTRLSNQMEKDPVDSQYYQTGEKRVSGVELTASGQITRNWNVSAGFTTMKAEVTRGAADANDGSNDLPYSPTRAFTSWTTYRLPFGLVVGGGARYNGELKRGSDGAAGTPEYTRAYWVADAMASYPVSKNLDVQLNVYNVFDKEYVAAINKSGYRYTPGTPLSAILSMNLKF